MGSILEVLSATTPPPTAVSLEAKARIDIGGETDPPFEIIPSSATVKVKGIELPPTGIVDPSGKLKVIFLPLEETKVTGTA
jgi:hypothetical protein